MAKSIDERLRIPLPVIGAKRFFDVAQHLYCYVDDHPVRGIGECYVSVGFSGKEDINEVLGVSTHIYTKGKGNKKIAEVHFDVGCACKSKSHLHEISLHPGRKIDSIPSYKMRIFDRIREGVSDYFDKNSTQ